jgi:hypothetical protein
MSDDFESSLREVDQFVYNTVLPQLRVVEENQYSEYGDELYDVFHGVMALSYHSLRARGWTHSDILESIDNIDEGSYHE